VSASADEPLLVSKALAARLLSVSVDTFERAVMPDIRVVRIGRRVLFSVADLGTWVEAHAALPLVSELPQHACENQAVRRRYSASLQRRRRGIVERTPNRRGDAGLQPAPRP
jgi:excisionase family DNA binding protein